MYHYFLKYISVATYLSRKNITDYLLILYIKALTYRKLLFIRG